MEMTSSVMRFALATYFMKRGYDLHQVQPSNLTWSPTTSKPNPIECTKFETGYSEEFSTFVSTHVSTLRQLLVEQRLKDWSRGVAELGEYVIMSKQERALLIILVKLIKRQEQDAVCIVQIVEHMCFEKKGNPSKVFDEFVELLLTALAHYCANKDVGMASWMLRAIHGIIHGLHQYHKHKYGKAIEDQFCLQNENMITEMIHDCLLKSRTASIE